MIRLLKIAVLAIILINLSFVAYFLVPSKQLAKTFTPRETVKVYDRDGTLLYEALADENGRQTYLKLEDIPTSIQEAFLAIEDTRFYEHEGVDWQAISRAIWQNATAGEVVSGGSTITQQLVRNLIGANKKRSLSQKLKETAVALKVSKMLSKDDVFELYLNTIYFGGLAYGVEAASWQYFGKSATQLDVAESAFLAGLPQAPNRYYPFRHFDLAKKRQKTVLDSMLKNEFINQDGYQLAIDEHIRLNAGSTAKKAPHFVDFVLSQQTDDKKLETTLNYGLQERVESILKADITFLEKFNIHNAAVLVLDAKQGDILAMVGSSDYHDEENQGQVNVITSLRQPGSSIKPLVYATAIEKGWDANTILLDEPVQFDTETGLPYEPKNYDLTYRGPVTVAEALAQSLNIPAVRTLDFVGVQPFMLFAEIVGLTTFTEDASHYGLALALGGAEVRLLELANAYSVFANEGKLAPYRYLSSNKPELSAQLIQKETVQTISAILSNNQLRSPAFGEENPLKLTFPVAAKTGTTRHFRDNWTIGYTDDYIVGVWVGNADGQVMQGVSGISGAGPIFYKVMNLLHEETGTALTVKPIEIKPAIEPVFASHIPADLGFRIISPFSNDIYQLDPNKPIGYQKIGFEASEPATWYVNGEFFSEGEAVLWPLERGEHVIKAASFGEEKEVRIQVQ